jgi:hypothetical protein
MKAAAAGESHERAGLTCKKFAGDSGWRWSTATAMTQLIKRRDLIHGNPHRWQQAGGLHDIGPRMKNRAYKEMKESNAKGETVVDKQPGWLVAREGAL